MGALISGVELSATGGDGRQRPFWCFGKPGGRDVSFVQGGGGRNFLLGKHDARDIWVSLKSFVQRVAIFLLYNSQYKLYKDTKTAQLAEYNKGNVKM